jgi:diguanylate cyclase (GGDEF)-like protein/PAS domain S-box-containing protein
MRACDLPSPVPVHPQRHPLSDSPAITSAPQLVSTAPQLPIASKDPALHEVLMAAADVAIWEWHPGPQTLVWYPAMAQMLGMAASSEAEVEQALRQLLAPILVSPRSPGEILDLEHTLHLPQRADRRYRLHARWDMPADTAPVLVGTVTDITNAQVEAAPAELRDRYRLLVELSPDAICVHCAGEIVFANRAGVAIIGAHSADDIIGKSIFGMVAPESRPGMIARIAAMKETDTYSEPAEATLMRLDGGTVVVESTSVRTQWEDKPAFQVIMRDLTHQKAAEANLRLSANLIEHVSDAIIATDVAGGITRWNPAAEALYGWSAEEAIGQDVVTLLEGHGGVSTPGADVFLQGSRAEVTHLRRDGSPVQVLTAVADMKDASGVLSGRVMIASDISERRKAERIRRQADARYSAAVAALDEGVLIIGPDETVDEANPAAIHLLGAPNLVGTRFADSISLLDDAGSPMLSAELGLEDTRRHGTARPAITAAVKRTGETLTYLQVSMRALPSESGHAPYPVVMCLLDVTDRHAAAALLRYEARHDHMTGLANRTFALETISELLATPHMSVGVLFIDLDRFKMVNDSLGHDAGDSVLRTISRRLAEAADMGTTVGRLAGDEFVLVVPQATERSMQDVAARMLSRLREPVRILGRDVVVTCSIGVVVTKAAGALNRKSVVATDILRDADVAMYYAKQHGRNRLATFDESFRRRAVDRLELEEDLRNGLERNEIWPAFQPIIGLRDMRISSAEALARWTHPTRGNVPPTAFIPIAEETGMIVPLGQHMARVAVEQLARWRRTDPGKNLVMSVNLSPRQLADPRVGDRVDALLRSQGLPPEALNLEITESALMDDPDLAAHTLARLRDLGVGISVDDFGTGYSSLSYLRRFPVTTVKIDRSFVERLDLGRPDVAIVAGIIDIGHTLGLEVVAEGVEEEFQLATLRDLGCDFAQGYLFSKPITAEAFTEVLLNAASEEVNALPR